MKNPNKKRTAGWYARRIRRNKRIERAMLIFLVIGHLALIALGIWAYYKVGYIQSAVGL